MNFLLSLDVQMNAHATGSTQLVLAGQIQDPPGRRHHRRDRPGARARQPGSGPWRPVGGAHAVQSAPAPCVRRLGNSFVRVRVRRRLQRRTLRGRPVRQHPARGPLDRGPCSRGDRSLHVCADGARSPEWRRVPDRGAPSRVRGDGRLQGALHRSPCQTAPDSPHLRSQRDRRCQRELRPPPSERPLLHVAPRASLGSLGESAPACHAAVTATDAKPGLATPPVPAAPARRGSARRSRPPR